MKLRVALLGISCAALAACGSKAPATSTVSNGGGTPATAVAAGIHGCHFVVEGTAYGEHRCDVGAGTLDKLSGMETFHGKLAPTADGVKVEGKLDCGEMATACDKTFSATLHNEGGTWRGKVEAPDAGDWFLAGSTFELSDAAGYGGEGYGGEGYGGVD